MDLQRTWIQATVTKLMMQTCKPSTSSLCVQHCINGADFHHGGFQHPVKSLSLPWQWITTIFQSCHSESGTSAHLSCQSKASLWGRQDCIYINRFSLHWHSDWRGVQSLEVPAKRESEPSFQLSDTLQDKPQIPRFAVWPLNFWEIELRLSQTRYLWKYLSFPTCEWTGAQRPS